VEPREKFLGRNPLLAVSLVKGIEKLSFLLGRESHSGLVTTSKDGHCRSLGERKAFYDDFAANYRS